MVEFRKSWGLPVVARLSGGVRNQEATGLQEKSAIAGRFSGNCGSVSVIS